MKKPTNIADKRQLSIAIDTVKNPAKELMGGMSVESAKKVLKSKFGYSDDEIARLEESTKGAILNKKERLLVKEYAKKLISKRQLTEATASKLFGRKLTINKDGFITVNGVAYFSSGRYGGVKKGNMPTTYASKSFSAPDDGDQLQGIIFVQMYEVLKKAISTQLDEESVVRNLFELTKNNRDKVKSFMEYLNLKLYPSYYAVSKSLR